MEAAPTNGKPREMAYELLRNRVIGGHYSPGTQLKEVPLARELNLSRTPVRTALKNLVQDGLATGDAGQGIRVAEWSDWDIEETFQLRILLEPYAARLAAGRGGEAMLEELRASNEKMARAIEEGGPHAMERMQEANQTFHHALFNHSGSPRLRAMLRTIIDVPIILRSYALCSRAEIEQSLHHHRDLTLAVEAHDAELAGHVMQLHLRMAFHRFRRRRSEYRRIS